MVFKNWAFRLFIYSIILMLLSFVISNSLITILFHITLLVGLLFGTLSILKKESNDSKKYIGFIGNLILSIIIGALNIFALNFLGYV